MTTACHRSPVEEKHTNKVTGISHTEQTAEHNPFNFRRTAAAS